MSVQRKYLRKNAGTSAPAVVPQLSTLRRLEPPAMSPPPARSATRSGDAVLPSPGVTGVAPAALLALAAGACADFDGLTAGSGGGGVLRLDGGSHPVDLVGGAADLAPPRDLAPAADLLPAPNIGPGSDVAEQVMATWDVG